jgi:hypothetical protein
LDKYDNIIESYADSDFNGKECFDGKATSGSIVYYKSMPILWYSKRQSIVTDKNCCSELYALNVGIKNSYFL